MSNKNTSRIDAYLSGKMSEAEHKLFEEEIAKDESFRKQVRLYRLEREAAIMMVKEEYRQKLTEDLATSLGKEEKPDTEKEQSRFPRKIQILAYAASLFLLLSLGLFWWVPQNYSNEVLVQNFDVDANDPREKGSDLPPNSVSFETACKTYFANPKDPKAKTLLEQIPDSLIEYHSAQYLLAYWYFHQGEHDKAIQGFDQVLLNLPSTLKKEGIQELKWARILALVGTNKLDENFYRDLKELKDKGTPHLRTEAGHLENKLASFWRKWLY